MSYKHPFSLSWLNPLRLLTVLGILLASVAQAQSNLIDVVQTIAGTDVAVPVEHSFTISAAGTYQVTLTDFGTALSPAAPLSSVKLAVTSGSTVLATLTAAGSKQFTAAAAGTYMVHVIGVPSTTNPGSGPIGIVVTNTSDNSTVESYSDTLALPPGSQPIDEVVLNDSFTPSTTGNYQVTLTDLQLPLSLTTLELALTEQGGTTLLTTLSAAGSATVALTEGVTYRIFAIGVASTSQNAGLFSASVVPSGGGAPIYSKTVPIGSATYVGSQTLTAGATYTMTLTDLAYPSAPLAQLGAVVALNGTSVAQLNAAGTTTFTGTADSYDVYAVGVATSPPGTGSYALSLTQAGTPVFNVAEAVATPGGALEAYSFTTNLASAGSYTALLADFTFQSAFTSLNAAVVQGTATLGTMAGSSGSTGSFTAAAGNLSLLVFAQPGAGGSLFGLNVTAAGTTTPTYQVTQGVGALFGTQKVTLTSSGTYVVNVADVGFPIALSNLAAIVTQGTSRLGAIYAGGTFSFSGTPGDYYVSLIAQPGGSDDAGTYALTVGPAPPAPVVTLTSSASSVASGGTVTLTWSATNATTCTASGGWSGSQSVSGTTTTVAITSSTTYTLTCTGTGGTTAQSVTVNIAVSTSGGGSGGGGAINYVLLLALAGALSARLAVARIRESRH